MSLRRHVHEEFIDFFSFFPHSVSGVEVGVLRKSETFCSLLSTSRSVSTMGSRFQEGAAEIIKHIFAQLVGGKSGIIIVGLMPLCLPGGDSAASLI